MEYVIPIFFLLLGFLTAFLAGRSWRLRSDKNALRDVPMKAGAVRLDQLGGKGAPPDGAGPAGRG